MCFVDSTAWRRMLGRQARGARLGHVLLSLVITILMIVVAAACDAVTGMLVPAAAPQACDQVFNAVRCLAFRDSAANQLNTTRENVVAVEILPAPTPEIRDGQVIISTTSGAGPIDLRVTLADGSTHPVTIHCGGIPQDPGCFDEPRLMVISLMNGYRDVPEGSSPVPTAAPAALAAGSELAIDRLDIPIDHVGRHDVRLGEALLPNGLLTSAEFEFVDDWPPSITIPDRRVSLEIRSTADGRPIRNIYEHGWREGAEPVEVFLVFDVFRYDPGAVLSIRNVLVR